jgi:deoxycytidine triphosphate deaminase
MIEPFNRDNLTPAGYELTVGDEYSLGGVKKSLAEGKEIRIDAFQVAIIKTGETLNLPRFMIARWNIRVRWAYQGLLWVGGPQVDPGWVGYLCCPIYNLSDKPVTLRRGDPLARLDFVTTTVFRAGKCREYPRPPKRVLFSDYQPEELKSALYTEAKLQIETIKKQTSERIDRIQEQTDGRMGRIEALMYASIASVLTILAILFAVLSYFFEQQQKTLPRWDVINSLLSGACLVVLVVIYINLRSRRIK